MPQIFQVLRCYKCTVFQVHQAKKSNKWQCKMCGENQSIKRHYGVGSGKECRLHVQRLNGLRQESDEANQSAEPDSDEEIEEPVTNKDCRIKQSKWKSFVNAENSESDNDSKVVEKMYLDDKEVVLDVPKKQRSYKAPSKFKNNLKKSEENDDPYESALIDQPCSLRYNKVIPKKKKPSFEPPLLKQNTLDYKATSPPKINNLNNQNFTYYETSQSEMEKKYFQEKVMIKTQSDKICSQPRKKSKWESFVEEAEAEDISPESTQSECPQSPVLDKIYSNVGNCNNLFSLCDDEDLDTVLNF